MGLGFFGRSTEEKGASSLLLNLSGICCLTPTGQPNFAFF